MVGIEAPGGELAEAAHALPLPLGAVRLGGVLEQPEAAPPAEVEEGVDVERPAIEMDADDAHRAVGHPRLGVRRIEVQGLGVDVGEDDLAAQQGHGLGRGEEAEGGDDHLVAWLKAEGAQAEDQGVGAVGEAGARLDAQIGGEGGFELLHLRAEDEGRLVEDALPALVELLGDTPADTAQIKNGDVHGAALYPVLQPSLPVPARPTAADTASRGSRRPRSRLPPW